MERGALDRRARGPAAAPRTRTGLADSRTCSDGTRETAPMRCLPVRPSISELRERRQKRCRPCVAYIDLLPKSLLASDALVDANFDWLVRAKQREVALEAFWATWRRQVPGRAEHHILQHHLDHRTAPDGTHPWASIPRLTLSAAAVVMSTADESLRPLAFALLSGSARVRAEAGRARSGPGPCAPRVPAHGTGTPMTILDPLRASERIASRYRGYLESTFRPQDDGLRNEFQTALHQGFSLTRGPYLEASAPFETGVDHRADGRRDARPRSAACPNRLPHRAIALPPPGGGHPQGGRPARNLVVSTGTGSGKTECFLLPIVDSLLREQEAGTLCPARRPRPAPLSHERPGQRPGEAAPRAAGRPARDHLRPLRRRDQEDRPARPRTTSAARYPGEPRCRTTS